MGVIGCLLAAWVWALRPRDWGARMFAATGLMLMVSAFAAAVYSSRELALPAHPRAEARVVVAPGAQLGDARHHVRRGVREVRVEPFAEQGLQFVRKADDRVGDAARAGGGCRLDDFLDRLVVQTRDDRRDHHPDRHACGGEPRREGLGPAEEDVVGASANPDESVVSCEPARIGKREPLVERRAAPEG